MKYNHILLCLLFSFFCLKSNAQIPLNGLIAYYPFNGNANDASGNGKHGVVNGASLTTDQNGNANSAYQFNGSSNYINLPYTFGPYNQMTISAWFKVSGTTTDLQAIISSDNSGKLFHMQTNTNSSPSNAIYYNNNTTTAILLPHPIATLNQWTHMCMTIQPGNTRLYINGMLVAQSFTNFSFISSANLLRIGSGNANTRFFNGKIDEIRMYNRSLSQDEVAGLYQAENPPTNYWFMTVEALIQGYYTGGNTMANVLYNQGIESSPSNQVDTILVDFYNTLYKKVYTYKGILQTNHQIQVGLSISMPIGTYKVGLRHRNALSTEGIFFSVTPGGSYSFSTNNFAYVGLVAPNTYALYSGDLNHDYNIDLYDLLNLEADINNFSSGYKASDLNGDGNVDLLDLPIMEENVNNFIGNPQ